MQENDAAFEEYRSIDAMNWSTLSAIAESPRLFRFREEHPRPDRPAFSLGRAIHCAVLEPDEFGERYIERPATLNARTKDGKAWLAEQASVGVTVLKRDEATTVIRVAEAVREHEHASKIVSTTEHEQTVQWVDEETGVACKARLDMLSWLVMADLKSTRELMKFSRDFARLRCHGQIAYYRDGAVAAGKLDDGARIYVVAAETGDPNDVGVFEIGPDVLEAGRNLYRDCLHTLLSCRELDHWPGAMPDVGRIVLPSWADGVRLDDELGVF